MSVIPPNRSAFAEDFAKFLSTSEKQLEHIEKFIIETGNIFPFKKEREFLAEEINLDKNILRDIFGVISHLYTESKPIEFDTKKIIDQLSDFCKEENLKHFDQKKEFIKRFSSRIEKVEKYLIGETLYKIGASYLSNFYYFVDIRPIIEDGNIKSLEPIIVTEFSIDNYSDEEKSINIQFNERSFKRFFDSINELMKELEIVNEYINKQQIFK